MPATHSLNHGLGISIPTEHKPFKFYTILKIGSDRALNSSSRFVELDLLDDSAWENDVELLPGGLAVRCPTVRSLAVVAAPGK